MFIAGAPWIHTRQLACSQRAVVFVVTLKIDNNRRNSHVLNGHSFCCSLYKCQTVVLFLKTCKKQNSNFKIVHRHSLEGLLLKTDCIKAIQTLYWFWLVVNKCLQAIFVPETAQMVSALVSWRQDWLSPLFSSGSFLWLSFPPRHGLPVKLSPSLFLLLFVIYQGLRKPFLFVSFFCPVTDIPKTTININVPLCVPK